MANARALNQLIVLVPFDYHSDSYRASENVDELGGRTVNRNAELVNMLRNNAGLLLIALAQAFFAIMNVFTKLLANPPPPVPPVSTFQLIFARMALTYIFAVIYMTSTGVQDWLLGPREVRWLLVLRGSVGFVGLFSLYYSLQYLSLSVATVLTFLVPFCTLFLGFVALGETFALREVVAGLIALAGVVCIARPFDRQLEAENFAQERLANPWTPTAAQRLRAVVVSLIGVVGASCAYVTIRFIGKRAHPLISVSIFSLFSCIYAAIGLIVTRQKIILPEGIYFAYLLALGVCGFVAQFLLTMGLQREKAGRGTTAIYLQLIFSLFWERVVFGTTPDLISILGMVLILCSCLYVALRNNSASAAPAATENPSDVRPWIAQDQDDIAYKSLLSTNRAPGQSSMEP
ncbi:hypothetical protein PYCC9005_000733 [Savitreella phatthalungensis]